MILGEDAGKTFLRFRDRNVRVKRELKKKSGSGTATSSIDKLKEKLESLKVLAWLCNYPKPRSDRSNDGDTDDDHGEITDVENDVNITQSSGESDKDFSHQSVAVTSRKIKSSTHQMKQKTERKRNESGRRTKTYQENIED